MKEPETQIRKLLETPFWPPGLEASKNYSRLHDDHDGTHEGHLNVMFSCDGDAWVMLTGNSVGGSLRFRMPIAGGGMSPRTRNALLILAEAIRLDNLDHPNEPLVSTPSPDNKQTPFVCGHGILKK